MEIRPVGTTNCANIYKLKYLIPLWNLLFGGLHYGGRSLNGLGFGIINDDRNIQIC